MPGEHGRYDLAAVVRWRLEWVERVHEQQLNHGPGRQLQEFRMELARLKVEEARENLVLRSDVKILFRAMIHDFKSRLLGLGRAIVAEFDSIPPRQRDHVMRERIEEVIKAIADGYNRSTKVR